MVSDEIWNQVAWMVRVPGTDSIVGPVSLDQVRRGLAHQKLDRAAEIAPRGGHEWRNAGAFLSEMMSRHGPPAILSQTSRMAAPSVDMSEYPDRPPPPPYATGPVPLPTPTGKASIRGLFPTAGRGKPPPPPDLRALGTFSPSDEPLPSDRLPLPAPPSSVAPSARGGPPPLPSRPSSEAPAAPKVHALPAPMPPKGGPRPSPATPIAGGVPFSLAPSAAQPRPPTPEEPAVADRTPAPARAAQAPMPLPADLGLEQSPTSTTVPSPLHTGGMRPVAGAPERPDEPSSAPAVAAVGLTPTSESTKAATTGPDEGRSAGRHCGRCGADAFLEPVTLGILGGSNVVLQLPDGTRAMVTAAMCGGCGDVRLTAEGARHLYEAMRRSSG